MGGVSELTWKYQQYPRVPPPGYNNLLSPVPGPPSTVPSPMGPCPPRPYPGRILHEDPEWASPGGAGSGAGRVWGWGGYLAYRVYRHHGIIPSPPWGPIPVPCPLTPTPRYTPGYPSYGGWVPPGGEGRVSGRGQGLYLYVGDISV